MTCVYDDLIGELRTKLKRKHISFNSIVYLINNQRYDKIIEIVDDETIHVLIEKIVAERERIGNAMEKKLNDLFWLNERLVQFGEEPQPSKTQALKVLKKKVFINIYDLESEKYERRTTWSKLAAQLRNYPEKRYPLQCAKEYITLQCFLIDCL